MNYELNQAESLFRGHTWISMSTLALNVAIEWDYPLITSARKGRGVQNRLISRTGSTDRLREIRTRGRESKISKILRTYLMDGP